MIILLLYTDAITALLQSINKLFLFLPSPLHVIALSLAYSLTLFTASYIIVSRNFTKEKKEMNLQFGNQLVFVEENKNNGKMIVRER